MTREQSSELNSRMAELNRQFKRRIAQIEHEHVMRLMATFQEFKARTFAIKHDRPSPEFYAGGNGDGATSVGPDEQGDKRRPQKSRCPSCGDVQTVRYENIGKCEDIWHSAARQPL